MHRLVILGLWLLCLTLTGNLAHAEKRVALVIGNSNYQHVPKLANPGNDAADMRTKLSALGFQLFGGADLDRANMITSLTNFGRAAENADVALAFYAGHGLQVNGQNYLVPTDANVEFEAELDIALVPFSIVMQQLSRGSRINIALLDACRDNPFSQGLSRSMGTRAVGSLGRGLSRVRSTAGTFIAYATEPDNVAQDGDGRNSPFTSALLNYMDRPGLSLSDMMIEVRNDVIKTTNGKQVPWDTSSLTGRFSFRIEGTVTITPAPPGASSPQLPPPPAPDRNSLELAVWNAIQNSNDVATLERFLTDFPDGLFAAAAREKLGKLKQPVVAAIPKVVEIDPCDEFAASSSDQQKPRGVEGVELSKIDPVKAVSVCRTAVAKNPDVGRFSFELGRALFRSGNYIEATHNWRISAEKGSASAMNNLGAALEFGYGSVIDAAQAARWYRAAADAGDATGMLNLSLAYAAGRGVAKDSNASQTWLAAAGDKGNLAALTLLQPVKARGAPQKIDNGNINAVVNGPRLPTEFTLDERWIMKSIYTYHWNNQKGRKPGKVSLRHESGKVFGPWQAAGAPGQGGVPNAYWRVEVSEVLPPGAYTVVDTDPTSWATNAGNGYRGFFGLEGWRLSSLN